MNTASCQSKITFVDGEKGILRYRGYPIKELAEKITYLETAYLILYGELPTEHRLKERSFTNPMFRRRHAMKTIVDLAIIGGFVLLVSCSIIPHPMDMTQAIQNARTRNDHEALAEHYEAAAKELREKAEEHKKRLARYEAISTTENPFRSSIRERDSIYSKQAPSLISHCRNLMHLYEQAAAQNTAMAKAHREIAAEIKMKSSLSEQDLRRT